MYPRYNLSDTLKYEAFDEVCKNKTRKQFKNALRVMYGKKKDRGHLKDKYQKCLSSHEKVAEVINEKIPIFKMIDDLFNFWY